MSAATLEAPPQVTALAAMLRLLEQAMRDRTWEHSPIGREVLAYMRALRWRSESTNTHQAYEQVLGLLALRHADWHSLNDFCTAAGTEYLREFLDTPVPRRRRRAHGVGVTGWLVASGYAVSVLLAVGLRRRIPRGKETQVTAHADAWGGKRSETEP